MAKSGTIKPMAQRTRMTTDMEQATLFGVNALAVQVSIELGLRVTQRDLALLGLLQVSKSFGNTQLADMLREEMKKEDLTPFEKLMNGKSNQ